MSKPTSRVCAVIAEETIDAARAAVRQAAGVADMFELRLDYLTDFDFADIDAARSLVRDRSIPAIVTCRAISEGGRQTINDDVRLQLLASASHFADYVDIEAAFYDQSMQFSPDTSRIIVSHHDFNETPSDLDAIYQRVTALPGAVHKIVTRANRISDSLAVFKLLERARADRRQLIASAMGEAGLITRVLGPAFGSFLTYGTLGEGKESAAGQLTCEQMVNQYRLHNITRATSITGIIGDPIGHSASPAMHNRAFADVGLDFVYLPLKVTDLAEFFRRVVNPESREIDWNLAGFSVTIPHKQRVIPFLHDVDDDARAAGAVNTIVFVDGRLGGYNTDVEGAIVPLEQVTNLASASCAVIGAGGAARAVIYGLLARGAQVHVFARNVAKAGELTSSLGIPVSQIERLESNNAQIVINTTPVGMRGHSEGSSPIPKEWLRGRRIAFDLVYNPADTRFLADARDQGCEAISGVEMLLSQAALQFELWTGLKAPLGQMREAAIANIAERDNVEGKSSKPL